MSLIGIDLGTSTTKIVLYDDKNNILYKTMSSEKSFSTSLNNFIIENNIDISKLQNIILTGVGSSKVTETSFQNIKITKVDEFVSTATGGLKLSNKKNVIIASIGTGTALIRVHENKIKHIGGSGLGGRNLN